MGVRRALSVGVALAAAAGAGACAALYGATDLPPPAGDASVSDAQLEGAADAPTDAPADAGLDAPGEGAADAAQDAAPDVNPLPGCAPGGDGLTNCGATYESCCTTLAVEGGTYDRSYLNDGGGPADSGDPATVSSLRVDKYEVTVGRFRQFVGAWRDGWLPDAGAGKHDHLRGGLGLVAAGTSSQYETGWVSSDDPQLAPTDANLGCDLNNATWTPAVATHEKLPINCENWYEAYAFCIWDGGFLPSEAEWEYTAAGGVEDRAYPWGDVQPGATYSYAVYGCYFPGMSGTCSKGNIAPVGSATKGAGLWGQLDLAGNLAEWDLDWFATYIDPCSDCASFTPSAHRSHRGGTFNLPTSYLSPSYRGYNVPTYRDINVGFRCARTP